MPKVRFDKFYRYNELTRILKGFAKEYPELIRLESIGKSHERRDVWLVTATNFKSGSDTEKPAFWVDGNIHASEVTASAAALYLIQSLVSHYRKDENTTRALDTRAFYIVPRVNPDGAEWALADQPKIIRSSTRLSLCRRPDRGACIRRGPGWRWAGFADANRGPERRLESASRGPAFDDPPRPD